uniref:Lipase domain-containing protein n=1 Tax=Timema poppense TaxID=170557 RepID=A0A7R9CT77_TIMPO|nr:unnamed protein product [Timema poppensis]
MNLIKLLAYIFVAINVGNDRFAFRALPKGNCSYCTPIDPAQDIVFLLYTRQNPDLPFQLKLNEDDLLALSPFDHEHPTVFYIHGFTELGLGLGCNTIKEGKTQFHHIKVDNRPCHLQPHQGK